MNRQRVHVHYSGRVQGVGFRYTARQTAAGYEVTGVVRNLSDGRVELVAEGAREELEAFLEGIRDSGLGAMITGQQASWSAAKSEFRGFEIVS